MVSMSLPKTVHLTNFYHASSGGISAFYRALLQHANRCGREMRLVAPGEQNGFEAFGTYGGIYQVKAPHSFLGDRRYRLILPVGPCVREVKRILMAERPDILEVSDKYTLPYVSGMLRKHVLRGVGRPTEIATSHERLDVNVAAHLISGSLGQHFARFYMHSLYFPMFDHHIANSEYTAAELVPASRGHSTRRGIWVCPMGLDTQFFANRTRRPHAGRRLLYAGRLSAEKNTALLIEMLSRLPQEYSLVIAGDGPQRPLFVNTAARLPDGRIEMKEHFANRDTFAQELANADVFVHPNPREPFGITVLEAMACGVPVVAPREGGVLSYANSDNAWLCEPLPVEFAATVKSVFGDPVERDRRISCARATAQQYDWTIIAERYFGLIDSLHEKGFHVETPPLGAALDAWRLAHNLPV
jgi:alpha-1,6-mannosyltransferase